MNKYTDLEENVVFDIYMSFVYAVGQEVTRECY